MQVGWIGGKKYHIFKMFILLAETVTLYSFCGHVVTLRTSTKCNTLMPFFYLFLCSKETRVRRRSFAGSQFDIARDAGAITERCRETGEHRRTSIRNLQGWCTSGILHTLPIFVLSTIP